ncbi:MFS transporter [Calothrix sp. PCC 7507]|uniref:MFS transporter n=1 Tax=Calothrix sp. PCC 7507 TaxID=99598 RepID=UPI00029EE1B9|nr:MFS transporter [Calothrix sp. PCC 7507]AFY34064.1 major facilitator superfamily MFS_1 [Calothrix sp. PCC 7507]
MKDPNSLLVKVTLLLASTLTVMAGATIAPSLPAIRDYFSGVSNVDYWTRLILTIPALFIAIGAPLVGTFIDRFGRKLLLAFAVLLYGLAGSSGVYLNSIGLILFGRVLLGLSVAGIMTTATTLIADYYTGAARAQFLGMQAAFMGFGGVLFLSLGGVLADVNWRLPFLIYLVAWLILPLVIFVLPEPVRDRYPTGTSQSPLPPPSEQLPWGLLLTIYAIAFITQIVFYLIPTQLPFYLQQLVNAKAAQSGLAIALATLATSISALSYPQLKKRFSFNGIYAIAFVLMGIGFSIISLVKSYELILVGLAIGGLGIGLLMPNMNVCLTTIVPATARGRVLGGLTTAFFLGQFISPILSQPLSQLLGIGTTYGWAGGLMLIMSAIAFSVVWRDGRK